MVPHGASNQDKLSLYRPSGLFSVPLPSMGGGGGVVIFTPWCPMVLPTKISCHCTGPLACFQYLSHPWGEGWSCNIHSMVLPTKISSHCVGLLACFHYLSHPWGEGVDIHSLVLQVLQMFQVFAINGSPPIYIMVLINALSMVPFQNVVPSNFPGINIRASMFCYISMICPIVCLTLSQECM